MSTGYTKGPWSNTPGQCTIWANDGDLKVARVEDLPWIENASGRKSSDWMTEAANARLIAAAPELLECCQELLRVAAIARERLGLDFESPAQERAKTLIGKATGGAVE